MLNTSPNVHLADHFSFIHDAINLQCFLAIMMPPPPPPPKRAQSNGVPLPPPAVTRNRISTPKTSFTSASQPPFPPAYSKPNSREAYGEIQNTSTGIAYRRPSESRSQEATFAYGIGAPSSYGAPKVHPEIKTSAATNQYQHNSSALLLLTPALASILWYHDSIVIIQIFIFVVLLLYGLDLMNSRDGLAVGIWIAALVLTMASGFGTLLQVDDADADGSNMILFLLRISLEGMLFCSMACWCQLQFRWLHKEIPSVAINMEKSLHSMIPPVTSSILTYHIVRLLMDYWGLDRVATLSPHLFALLMTTGMVAVGCSPSSFEDDITLPTTFFSIPSFSARIHSMLLLLLPGVMHILIFHRRIFSRYAGLDELYDLILVWSVPYLLHCGLLLVTEKNPYDMPNQLFPKSGENTLRGAVVPMGVSLLASIAAQQRYLIPLCNTVSYQFNGHDLSSTMVVSIYLTAATLAALLSVWTLGRKSSLTGELLFGEYHEDVVQLSISISGLLLGKAFGMPWNLTPLPILAFLGLSVWVTSRMLRYLSIFLFVVHAAGVVVFSYRFAAIDMTIPLALPGIEVGLIRFGMIEVAASVLIGLVLGFAARPVGGFGAAFLKRVDVAGGVLILYCLLLTTLEFTLLRRLTPQAFVGKESDSGIEDDGFLYDHATALLTSAIIIGVSLFSKHLKVITAKSSLVAMSLAIGKATAVIIDANESDGKIRSEVKHELMAQRLLYRSLVAAALLIVMMAPRTVMNPIHIKKNTRYKRNLSDGKPLGTIPARANRTIFIYSLVILPLALLASIPLVLTPLVMALSAHYGGGAYYSMAPPVSEMLGFSMTLWGISSLSMLNHYLPDGGAEIWKKASALTLLMGAGVAFSAPTVPEWIVGDDGFGVSNPYAAISSLGTRLVTQGRSRIGGWGILSASLATLLAVTGPLELRERRFPSGRKDKQLLLRLMIFSIMFGSGVSWFITMQSMSQESFVVLLVTALSCMVVSFFGTVTCVLGYFLELENFDEVEQMAKVLAGAFAIFGLLAAVPSLLSSSLRAHAFGAGGWFSTYLIVSCCVTSALSWVLRLRSSKNQSTTGLGNFSCVLSYTFAIIALYGRFGVAGLDQAFDITTIFGIPASVFGTILISPMLFALEGEDSHQSRSRVDRINSRNIKTTKQATSVLLKNLNASNRYAPLLICTLLVLYMATLYTIFLRGSFFFGSSVPKSHVDVFSSIFEKNSLAAMAEKSISQSQALVVSARLAGSGFWTAGNFIGPLLHICGLAAAVPSAFLLIAQVWSGIVIPKAQVVFALPLNAVPLLLCKGIPSLRVASLVGLIGGVVQLIVLQQRDHRSHMRI